MEKTLLHKGRCGRISVTYEDCLVHPTTSWMADNVEWVNVLDQEGRERERIVSMIQPTSWTSAVICILHHPWAPQVSQNLCRVGAEAAHRWVQMGMQFLQWYNEGEAEMSQVMKHGCIIMNLQANVKAWSGNMLLSSRTKISKVCLLLAKWCWWCFGTSFGPSSSTTRIVADSQWCKVSTISSKQSNADKWSCSALWRHSTLCSSSIHWNDVKTEIQASSALPSICSRSCPIWLP